MRLPPATAIIAALALAGTASAQTPDSSIEALTPGRRALSFNLPDGGGFGLGYWRVVAPDRARGFFVNANAHYVRNHHQQSGAPSASDDDFGTSISFGPQARRYFTHTSPVAPFIQSGVSLGASYNRASSQGVNGEESGHVWTASAGVSAGPGVEWFPLRRVSLAGQTGINASVLYNRATTNAGPGYPGSTSSSWSLSASTFVSSLMLQVYF